MVMNAPETWSNNGMGRLQPLLDMMLKRIPVMNVVPGMFIQSLEGPWLSHPFWKTKFVLTDDADIHALKASGVTAVWIDPSKGVDESAEIAAPSRPGVPCAATSGAENVLACSESNARTSFAGEIERAAKIIQKSRRAVETLFNDVRLGKVANGEELSPLVIDIADSLARNPSAFVSLARLKTKDDYTYMHSVAVCALMIGLARQQGLNSEGVRLAGLAGLLHDIGKAVMPPDILNKPGALSPEEFDIMKSHPERGLELLKDGIGTPAAALDVCLHHHEKVDGTGYPFRLAHDEISLLARMGAVCDVYDAVTSVRPYKSAWDPAVSIQRMSEWKGHFDPNVFASFVLSVGIYPTGALVRLTSGRLAVVIEQNCQDLTSPCVKAFFSTRSNLPIPPVMINLSSPMTAEKIVSRESPEQWGFRHLEDLRCSNSRR